jgi:hypothetical protein
MASPVTRQARSAARRLAPAARRLAPAARRLAVFAMVAVAVGLGAWTGAWWVPFLAGVACAAWSTRVRGVVLVAVAGAVVGWAVPLWILALRGFPAGATARVIAGLAGLPPHAPVTVAVTLLLAALQALVGAWLVRAFAPRAPRG